MSIESNSPKRSRNPMDFNFLDAEPLSRFVTETGKILPRRVTGLPACQQRHVTRQIKRARNLLTMK
jgi:small subunit ribosomal protein S18